MQIKNNTFVGFCGVLWGLAVFRGLVRFRTFWEFRALLEVMSVLGGYIEC